MPRCCCPVPYFLVTFTVPEGLRRWIRSHPASGYNLLLAASSQALQDLAQNPKRLGATLGLLGVLAHLDAHPRIPSARALPGARRRLEPRTSANGSPAAPASCCRSKP